jgi:hypothetical protein
MGPDVEKLDSRYFEHGTHLATFSDIDKMKGIIDSLWSLLDDIDTLSDKIKPTTKKEYMNFYHHAMYLAKIRHNYVASDGYSLFIVQKKNI